MKTHDKIRQLVENIGKVYLGEADSVKLILTGLLSNGHLLIEDVPGVGKTTLAKALAKSIDCSFQRIQFTPDLLPSDILGVSVYNNKTNEFVFNPGPIFANVVLADEINRTTPRTQSSLLEAMNDYQVTVDRRSYQLERPFLVIATQNPYEFEGTYPLPESQLDRFLMKLRLGYPSQDAERQVILNQRVKHPLENLQPIVHKDDVLAMQREAREVRVDESLVSYILDIVEYTRRSDKLDVGISPRGSVAMFQAVQSFAYVEGRDYAIPDDVKKLAVPVLAHRVISRAVLHGMAGDANSTIIEEALSLVAVPV